MAAILTFTTKFNLMTNPKKFVFIDTTNYPAQSPAIATANVVGNITVTSPSGVVTHTNTNFGNTPNVLCDIDINVSTTNQTLITLPTSGGIVEPGVYTILYTVYDKNLLVYYTKTNTYTYSYVSPEVEILLTADCLSPLLTSKDNTEYVVDGITPVKVETNTINYPFGSAGEGAPTIGNSITTTTSTFYQGTQTAEISSTLTYTYSDGLIVLDLVTGAKEILVDCKDVCGIYCCIRSIEQKMNTESTSNRVEWAKTSKLFAEIMGYVSLALLAIRCGKSDDVNGFLSTLRTLSSCTSDCGCSGTEPTQVTGLGGLVNQVVVNGGNANITVTPVTVGNTTTYTVTLSTSFSALVNSLYNTVVAAGNNVTVTGPVIAGIVHTYTVNALKATVGSADGSITVTPGAVAAGVQNYDLAVGLDYASESTDNSVGSKFVVAATTNTQSVTGAIGVAPSSGQYLIIYEADFAATGASMNATLYLAKTGGSAVSNLRNVGLTTSSGNVHKIVCTAFATLAAGNTVTLIVNNVGISFDIYGRSIIMVKIA